MTARPRDIATVPNALTLVRLLLIPVFLFASFRGMFTVALVLFVTAAVTDPNYSGGATGTTEVK